MVRKTDRLSCGSYSLTEEIGNIQVGYIMRNCNTGCKKKTGATDDNTVGYRM
jgi:hypothetical protein